MNPVRVVIVDDHPLFRQGVVDTLALENGFRVIGEAADGDEALALIRQAEPDVVVLDVNLPGKNGLQITRCVREDGLRTRVVLVTAYDDAEQMIHAVRSGAAAYCPKYIQPEDLVRVLRLVAAGQMVFGSEVLDEDEVSAWVEDYVNGVSASGRDLDEPIQPLSKREMEVLSCVTQGLSNKEIAALLGISYQTVKNHVTAILRKLNVDDRTQAAVYALRRGWFQLYNPRVDAGAGTMEE